MRLSSSGCTLRLTGLPIGASGNAIRFCHCPVRIVIPPLRLCRAHSHGKRSSGNGAGFDASTGMVRPATGDGSGGLRSTANALRVSGGRFANVAKSEAKSGGLVQPLEQPTLASFKMPCFSGASTRPPLVRVQVAELHQVWSQYEPL